MKEIMYIRAIRCTYSIANRIIDVTVTKRNGHREEAGPKKCPGPSLLKCP